MWNEKDMENMTLLAEGKANWDYYHYIGHDLNCVVSVAKKGSGACTTMFGSMEYYNTMVQRFNLLG
jgi:hypothetical protein